MHEAFKQWTTRNPAGHGVIRALLITAFLAMMIGPSLSQAKNAGIMVGVFCKSRENIEQMVMMMRHERDAEAALAVVNKDAMVCAHPLTIGYMIEDYVQLGKIEGQSGQWYLYRGTHIGVMVGTVPMPLSAPVTQYFVSRKPLPGAVVSSGI